MTRTLALLPLLSLTGCFEEERACDTSLRFSVNVAVSAEDGGDVSGAVVTHAVDGGAFKPCESVSGAGDSACGMDVAGTFVIRVEADGYVAVDEEVVVEAGECHVESQSIAVVLIPEGVECTAEVVPSVLATIVASGGEALTGVNVQWGYRDADMAPQACSSRGGDAWACGEEVAGDLEIYAAADGHGAPITSVHVDADECHVLTETVEIALDWLPD